jgi:hypothetical protein
MFALRSKSRLAGYGRGRAPLRGDREDILSDLSDRHYNRALRQPGVAHMPAPDNAPNPDRSKRPESLLTRPFTPDPASTRDHDAESSVPDGDTADSADFPTVPGYEILGEIARGGMGVVFAARNLAFGREVAVKTLLPRFADRATWAAQFEREAIVTGNLPHPGVPPVHARGSLRRAPVPGHEAHPRANACGAPARAQ